MFLSVFRYPGGKRKLYERVLPFLEGSRIFIEPFCGGGNLSLRLLFQGVVDKIILNDSDPGVYAVWYSILYRTEGFIRALEDVEVSIEEWERQKRNQGSKDILELALSTLYLNRTNRSGIIKGGLIGGRAQNGNYKMDARFNKKTLVKRIKKIAAYKDKIEIYNLDFEEFLKVATFPEESFFFVDPPYVAKGKGLYNHFFLENDHIRLKKVMATLKNWMITYDNSVLIKEIYKKWPQSNFDLNYSIAGSNQGKELMILNI